MIMSILMVFCCLLPFSKEYSSDQINVKHTVARGKAAMGNIKLP